MGKNENMHVDKQHLLFPVAITHYGTTVAMARKHELQISSRLDSVLQ